MSPSRIATVRTGSVINVASVRPARRQQQRRREIGILKALGATDGQIQSLFVMHGGFLVLVGSLLGVASACTFIWVAGVLSGGIEALNGVQLFKVDLSYVGSTVIVAIALGIIAAFAPARRAAEIDPVEMMRES